MTALFLLAMFVGFVLLDIAVRRVRDRLATARAQGERVLMWKVDTRDWSRSATVESVLANLRSQVEPGAIVLLHDAGGSNRFTSLAVLAGLIDELRAQGYEFTFPVIDPA